MTIDACSWLVENLYFDIRLAKGQVLRFGEHNVAMLRRELHLAVDEEIRLKTKEEKDTRKHLLDRVWSRNF